MTVKELITELLNSDMDSEVFIRTEKTKKINDSYFITTINDCHISNIDIDKYNNSVHIKFTDINTDDENCDTCTNLMHKYNGNTPICTSIHGCNYEKEV